MTKTKWTEKSNGEQKSKTKTEGYFPGNEGALKVRERERERREWEREAEERDTNSTK